MRSCPQPHGGPGPAAACLALLLAAVPVLGQNPVSPAFSYLEKHCDHNLVTIYRPQLCDPLGDLGLVVHCLDADGQPVAGIPPEAFSVEVDGTTVVMFDGAPVADRPTDEQGRVLLTEPFPGFGTLVHGRLFVRVSLGGVDVVIDNGGVGVPVEIRSPDFNRDYAVNLSDLAILGAAYDCCQDTPTCLRADFDGDGCVSLADRAIFERFYGTVADAPRAVPAPGSPRAAHDGVEPFIGCIQADFDEDGDPATLQDEIVVMPFTPFTLKFVAADFSCLSGVDCELAVPAGLTVLSTTAYAPFGGLLSPPAPAGHVRRVVVANVATAEPAFVFGITMMATQPTPLTTGMFPVVAVSFADCSYPPATHTPCIGSPTPCEVSHVRQGKPLFLTCPGGDGDVDDVVTVVLLDQDGSPLPGIPADDLWVRVEDRRGSGRGGTFGLSPLAAATDENGELPYLFAPRESCRWDECLDLLIRFRYAYQGCELSIAKSVRTVDVSNLGAQSDGRVDLADVAVVGAAMFTLDDCLDLDHRFRCPVVSAGALDLLMGHLGHACDWTATPPAAGDGAVRLSPGAPNPFNPRTCLTVELAQAAQAASLTVYDVRGLLVRRLWDGALAAGAHAVWWDGRDEAGGRVASGVYFARLSALGRVAVARLALVD